MVGWNGSGYRWQRTRRQPAELPEAGGWTVADTGILLVAAYVRWELAAAFLALKLWQQASGYRGSTVAFARDKWQGLVEATRALFAGGAIGSLHVGSLHMGARSSGNAAFDRWRRSELTRIDAERGRLRDAERDFAAYRDELLHAKDHEDFERFMQARHANADQVSPDQARPELRRGASV